jgi:7,8-dihydropterin-6-yl-methyl-4-(beta-D-ribofuranosyl)aminobenzene 5'-phosphate synthase
MTTKVRNNLSPILLREVDAVEILCLQDNFIDNASFDSNQIVQRASPGLVLSKGILAEHGFSVLVSTVVGDEVHRVLFDFGLSEYGAAYHNAEALNVDFSQVEAMVLSHGHIDHFGGILPFARKVDRKNVDLILHPGAFKELRYFKDNVGNTVKVPSLSRAKLEAAGVSVIASTKPRLLRDSGLLFLGEIPRKTKFEKGTRRLVFSNNGQEQVDLVEEDSAIVANVKNRGLVVVTGCAHSGLINTIRHAQGQTGVERVFAVFGGFHLSDPDSEVIEPTVEALKQIDPQYIVPAHCTGHKASFFLEKELPEKVLLNMSGTTMKFRA